MCGVGGASMWGGGVLVCGGGVLVCVWGGGVLVCVWGGGVLVCVWGGGVWGGGSASMCVHTCIHAHTHINYVSVQSELSVCTPHS